MIEVALNNEKSALIDDDDFIRVAGYLGYSGWYAYYDRKGKNWYAVTNARHPDGTYTQIRMHRLIMNAEDGQEVDHINHDGLDNRKDNLRIADRGQNSANRRIAVNNSSGYKGVYWQKERGKWRAHIRKDKKNIHLGYFDSVVKAAIAYDEAARELFGEFALLNFAERARVQ